MMRHNLNTPFVSKNKSQLKMPPAKAARPASKRGFTIVEILVVVAIIALLSAILVPVLGRARENGKRSACSNNLRQIALGLQQYTQDNDRRFPPMPDFSGNEGEGWISSLEPTVKSPGIFQCPSESKKGDRFATDYWLNANFLGKSNVRVRTAVSVIMLGDGDQGVIDYVFPVDGVAGDDWQPGGGYATRHLGGSNFAFADGHVKWLRPDQVSISAEPDGTNATFIVG